MSFRFVDVNDREVALAAGGDAKIGISSRLFARMILSNDPRLGGHSPERQTVFRVSFRSFLEQVRYSTVICPSDVVVT